MLEGGGPVLGVLPVAPYGEQRERLGPGDLLVLYSDGVTEAQNQNREFYGKKRLNTTLTAHAGESCGAIHDAIQADVAAFTEGAPQSDDITVVVLEYRGKAIEPPMNADERR